jgi:outer membrane protein assembly factor BamE (lipoprotein component of BamABCDE complex)
MDLILTLGSVRNKKDKNEICIGNYVNFIKQSEIQINFNSENESTSIYMTHEDFEKLFEAMTQYKNKLEKEKENIHNEAI